MYYLRDLEEQMNEYHRYASSTNLEGRDLDVLEEIQRERDDANTGLKQRLATVLVDLGIKVHAEAAVQRATSHEAA